MTDTKHDQPKTETQSQSQSHQPSKPYVPGYGQVNHHEWRTAENSAQYFLPALQKQISEKSSIRLLDIGCGSGTITASFAKFILQQLKASGKDEKDFTCEIVAVDLTDEILVKTRDFAAKSNVSHIITTRPGSVFDLVKDFGEQHFDLVHTSMMLVHLDNPVEALRQMIKVCKSRGVVAAREADLRMMSMYPTSPWLQRAQELQVKIHEANGGTPGAGVTLIAWAIAAGASREQIDFSMGTWCYCTLEERRMWADAHISRLKSGSARKQYIEIGGLSEADVENVISDWKAWAELDYAVHASMHGQLLINL